MLVQSRASPVFWMRLLTESPYDLICGRDVKQTILAVVGTSNQTEQIIHLWLHCNTKYRHVEPVKDKTKTFLTEIMYLRSQPFVFILPNHD